MDGALEGPLEIEGGVDVRGVEIGGACTGPRGARKGRWGHGGRLLGKTSGWKGSWR